jgi:hypothetical protein
VKMDLYARRPGPRVAGKGGGGWARERAGADGWAQFAVVGII